MSDLQVSIIKQAMIFLLRDLIVVLSGRLYSIVVNCVWSPGTCVIGFVVFVSFFFELVQYNAGSSGGSLNEMLTIDFSSIDHHN